MENNKNKAVWYVAGESLFFVSIIFSMVLVSACMSDVQCAGQGQDICQNKQIHSYHCIDNSCQISSEIGSVECCTQADCPTDQTCQNYACVGGAKQVGCTLNSDCGNNQICDTLLYKCVDVNPGQVIPADATGNDYSSKSNSLIYVLIIAGAIVIGFIILAVILSRKKSKRR
jgi:hypothetical protein